MPSFPRFRAADDRLRVVLIMTLESAGHIFFERVASRVSNREELANLKYFSLSHLELERSHEVFQREMAERISSTQLTPELRDEAQALVDRCYTAFGSMFDALCTTEKPIPARPPTVDPSPTAFRVGSRS